MDILSAEKFIQALQGHEVKTETSKVISYLKTDSHGDTSVQVNNVIVKEQIIIGRNTIFPWPIYFYGGEFEKGFFIYDSRFEGGFVISGGNFHNNLSIYSGDFFKNFEIYAGMFRKMFCLYGGNFSDGVIINSGIFEGTVFIGKEGVFKHGFIVKGGAFNKNFIVQGGKYPQGLKIIGGEFKEQLHIVDGNFQMIEINNEGLNYELGRNYNPLLINELYLKTNTRFEMRVEKCSINQLIISNLLRNTGSLYLKNLSLNSLVFEGFINESKVSISDIRGGGKYHIKSEDLKDEVIQNNDPSLLSIRKSDMGNTSFFNMDFLSFDKIGIEASRLSDIKTTNYHLPISSEKTIRSAENEKQNAAYLEELYNQLYLAMQKQGNRTQEIKYYAEYLEWHRKNKCHKLDYSRPWKLLTQQDWYTPISLWLHKQSSNYGTHWVKSFLFLVPVGWFFYFLYALSLPEVNFGFNHFTFENVSFHLKYYIEFLLPTHRLEFIPETNAKWWSNLLDIIGRICVGFLIYQTVAAFRRFGRK